MSVYPKKFHPSLQPPLGKHPSGWLSASKPKKLEFWWLCQVPRIYPQTPATLRGCLVVYWGAQNQMGDHGHPRGFRRSIWSKQLMNIASLRKHQDFDQLLKVQFLWVRTHSGFCLLMTLDVKVDLCIKSDQQHSLHFHNQPEGPCLHQQVQDNPQLRIQIKIWPDVMYVIFS